MKAVELRNYLMARKYRWFLKPVFFRFQPETIHDLMSILLSFLGKFGATRRLATFCWGYSHTALEQDVLGIHFQNPVGLSAGFDKNANMINIMPSLGFGFTEVGSITALPYGGNPRPRLYRLPEHLSLRVNYGLKNEGAYALHSRLQDQKWPLPVGISIAKTNAARTSDVDAGIDDYFYTYLLFQDTGDYFTINISCPNTCEEKPIFAEPENFDKLLQKIFSIPKKKPVFVKLSPDLQEAQLNGLLEACRKYPVDGFVCSNLTKRNSYGHMGKGGFSGKAVQEMSDALIEKVYKFYGGEKIVVGVGGIFTAEDAYRKIKAGASLLELITGMIFLGPQAVSDINIGLVKLLKRDGYKNISEAVGKK